MESTLKAQLRLGADSNSRYRPLTLSAAGRRHARWGFSSQINLRRASLRMTRNPYENDVVISWPELHRDARFLSHELHEKGQWKGILAVTRGGMVAGARV